MTSKYLILTVICYLVGSFPTAYLMGKIFKGIDVRKHGSKNVGATNALRVLGKKYGIPTLIIDILKGFIPVLIVPNLLNFSSQAFETAQIVACISVIAGHVWTVFLKFKGGKGIATSCGAFLSIAPLPTFLSLLVFFIVFKLFSYVSLGSILAALTLPLFIFFIAGSQNLTIFSGIIALLVILKHLANIKRLINGTEGKIKFKSTNKYTDDFFKDKKIVVIGDGGWGTTIALVPANKNYNTTLWGFFPKYVETLKQERRNVKFLPNIKFPDSLKLSSDIEETVKDADIIVLATPSQHLRSVCETIKPHYKEDAIFAIVSKGIENNSLKRMSEVAKEVLLSENIVSMSGPSHAEETAENKPTTLVAASAVQAYALQIQALFMYENLRIYAGKDIVGVELGGSLKNVIAIAAGMCDGMNLGDNAKAALITRGISEITRLGVKMGAKKQTFAGLSGIGDLITTCVSDFGRNKKCGMALATGKTKDQILSGSDMVIEGIATALSAHELSQKYKVETPIIEAVYQVLYKDLSPKEALTKLMTRAPKKEF